MATVWDALLHSTLPQRFPVCHLGTIPACRSRVSEIRLKDIGADLSPTLVREGSFLKSTVPAQQLFRCRSVAPFSNPRFQGSAQRKGILLASKGDDLPGNDNTDDKSDEENRAIVDQALNLDGRIPSTSDGFVKTVSSRAYDMRRHLEQNMDASSYDVLEANPWRDSSKPVYVLAKEEDQLLTMRTRRPRSEVERELGLLFPKRGSRRGKRPPRPENYDTVWSSVPASNDTSFRVSVEDVREGVLVFEDKEEATRYCSLLDGQGKNCMGVAEFDASDVFAMCQNTSALAVVFRRGQTPPQPDRLQLNLKARKRSLED